MERDPALTPPSPRVLLVEDDPISRGFLAAAVEALPAKVDGAEGCAAALQLARAGAHDLWLIDANLPDGNGQDLLQSLRAIAPHTPALAHTASRDRRELDALAAAGFLEVLVKPLGVAALQSAVRRALGQQPSSSAPHGTCGKLPVWDDVAAALALHGNRDHVAALRQLFLGELPGQRADLRTALEKDDADGVRTLLHRLQASCGFVGALRLAAAVTALQGDSGSAALHEGFEHAVDDVLARGLSGSG